MSDRQQSQTQRQMQANPAPPGGQAVLHPTLVPELLGFSPQMLLDDIINTAAEAILQCITAMEHFMQRWAESRAANPPPPKEKEKEKKGKGKKKQDKAREQAQEDAEWDAREAVERALVAFSTLLESHTDVAFDFFEAWSMRNIFAIPPDLPVVAPHQRGLDLNPRPEEEAELMTDIEELRRKIENQRRLRRMYMKAVRIARIGRLRSERRLARLSYLSSPLAPSPSSSPPPITPNAPNTTDPTFLSALSTLPPSVHQLFEQAAALPHIEGLSANALPALPDPSKRLWETSHTGYVNWAVQQLITRSKESAPAPSGGSTAVSNAMDMTEQVGETGDIRIAVEVLKMEEERQRAGEHEHEHEQGMEVDT